MGRRSDTKCACYGLAMFLVNAVAIAMVVIGAINTPGTENENGGCPSQKLVPWFLIIGGSIVMCGIFVREILKRTCECCNDCCDGEKCCRISGKILKFSTTVLFDAIFLVIVVGWWLFGTVRMVSMYEEIIGKDVSDKIQTIQPDTDKVLDHVLNQANIEVPSEVNLQATFEAGATAKVDCSDLLYYFTFAVLIAGWVLAALSALFLLFGRILYNLFLCRPCKDPYRETSYDTRYA